MTNNFFSPSVNKDEVNRFNDIADEWWDENGKFKPLHQLNPTRLTFIRECLLKHFKLKATNPLLLKNLTILDIGCGGGIVCEPLARLGARLTGIDASPKTIEIAKTHANAMELEIDYRCTSAEELAAQKMKFDVVLALEIIEHVNDVSSFLKTCTNLIASNGILILSTLNRTWQAYLMAIIGAEYILRWLPKGTHEWHKFITPAELTRILRPLKFQPTELKGLVFNPFSSQWQLGNNLSVNYLICCKQTTTLP